MGSRQLVSTRLNNKVLADKNEVDKDEVNKNEAENDIIAGLVTLELQLLFFLAWAPANVVLVGNDLWLCCFCDLMKNPLIW